MLDWKKQLRRFIVLYVYWELANRHIPASKKDVQFVATYAGMKPIKEKIRIWLRPGMQFRKYHRS